MLSGADKLSIASKSIIKEKLLRYGLPFSGELTIIAGGILSFGASGVTALSGSEEL